MIPGHFIPLVEHQRRIFDRCAAFRYFGGDFCVGGLFTRPFVGYTIGLVSHLQVVIRSGMACAMSGSVVAYPNS